MCCRRRQRRAPLVVTLGKMAINKYEETQARKHAIANASAGGSSSNQRSMPSESPISDSFLEKAGTQPPSYNDLVVGRAIVSPKPNTHVDSKETHGLPSSIDRQPANSPPSPVYNGFDAMKAKKLAKCERKLEKCKLKFEYKVAKKAEKEAHRAGRME